MPVAIARCLVVAVSLLAAAPALAAEARPLRVVVNHYLPPMSWVTEDHEFVGFDVDLAEALCDRMKLECTVKAVAPADRIPGLLQHRFDVLVASVVKTPQRARLLAFSRPYARTSSAFVARKDGLSAVSVEALQGRSVIIRRNPRHEAYLRETFGDGFEIDTAYSVENAMQAVAEDDAVAAFVPTLTAAGFMRREEEGADLAFVGSPVTEPPFGRTLHIAVRPQETALLDKVNEALAAVMADGTYQELMERWFPAALHDVLRPPAAE